MPRPCHFDLGADDPKRAMKFYKDIFGWKFEKWADGQMEYWMITTGKKKKDGINGGLSKRDPEAMPNMNTIDCLQWTSFQRKLLAREAR